MTPQDLTWTSSTIIKKHLSSFEEAAERFRYKLYTPTEIKRALSVLCPRPLITPAASVFTPTVGEHNCLWPGWMFTGVFCCKHFSPCTPELLSAEPVIILTGIYTPHISSKLFPLWLSFKGVGEESDEETGFFSFWSDTAGTELSTVLRWQYESFTDELRPSDFSPWRLISKYTAAEQRDKQPCVCLIKQESFVAGCCYK